MEALYVAKRSCWGGPVSVLVVFDYNTKKQFYIKIRRNNIINKTNLDIDNISRRSIIRHICKLLLNTWFLEERSRFTMWSWEISHWLWRGLHVWDYINKDPVGGWETISQGIGNVQWITKILTSPAGSPGTPMKWTWFCANAMVGWYPFVLAPGVIVPEVPADKSGLSMSTHGIGVELAAVRRPMSSENSWAFE